jgi:hypothetical protein
MVIARDTGPVIASGVSVYACLGVLPVIIPTEMMPSDRIITMEDEQE